MVKPYIYWSWSNWKKKSILHKGNRISFLFPYTFSLLFPYTFSLLFPYTFSLLFPYTFSLLFPYTFSLLFPYTFSLLFPYTVLYPVFRVYRHPICNYFTKLGIGILLIPGLVFAWNVTCADSCAVETGPG